MEIGARFVENDAMVGSEDDGWVVVDRFGRRAADRTYCTPPRPWRLCPDLHMDARLHGTHNVGSCSHGL